MTTPLQLRMGVEAPHRNRYLFSDHYLENILPEDPRWQQALTEAETFCDWLREHYADEKDQLPDYNESQLEQYWFRPIFERLGHVFELQASVPGLEAHAKRPDYVFFPDEGSRQRAASLQNEEEYAEEALAVGEVKRWDTPLSKKRRGGGPSFEDQNPSFQIDYYVRITAKSGLDWGILTNGRLWRLVHKDSSQRLDIYYEVDLVDLLHRDEPGLMRYFLLFFRQAAFRPDAKGRVFLADVLAASNAYAVELEEDVEENVYHALEWLMQGFLDLPENELGPDDLQAVYDNSLYLLYRLLFILYGESRGLLPMDEEDYRERFSLEAIKQAITEDDLPRVSMTTVVWGHIYNLFRIISGRNEELNRTLNVPRYDGRLFDPEQHPFLEEKEVGDQALVAAIDLLSRRETDSGREFVDYRTLSVRHLGSIYEGLLEYQPRVAEEPLVAVGDEWLKTSEVVRTSSHGNLGSLNVVDRREPGQVYLVTDRGERKATGSYYTPQYIVEYIVEHTLGPLVERGSEGANERGGEGASQRGGESASQRGSEAANNGQAFVDAILDLKVLDPAMGSGHFLVEATEYLARVLATDPYVEAEQVADEDLTYWKRRVVERCIYGVDKNPLAVELAKLSLWLATVAADRPLSFLDHHLKCGDSLIGARVDDLGWAPPPALSKQAQKQVEQQKAGQINMFGHMLSQKLPTVMGRILEITEQESKDYDTVRAKEAADRAVRELKAPFEAVADMWVSAYFGNEFINGEYDEALGVIGQPDTLLGLEAVGRARAMAEERGFFHWELAFPEVFYDEHGQRLGEAGFDVVMGNPPYVRVQKIRASDEEVIDYFRGKFQSASASFDLYLLFVEKASKLTRRHGLVGLILPNKFFTANYGYGLRAYLSEQQLIRRIVNFTFGQVFSGATTYTALLFLEPESQKSFEYIQLVNPRSLQDAESREFRQIPLDTLGSEPWVFLTKSEMAILEKTKNLSDRLGEIAERMFQGIRTSDNEVYVIQDVSWRDGGVRGKSGLGTAVEIEDEICRPFLAGEDIARYEPIASDKAVIVPYRRGREGWELIPEEVLEERFPLAYSYLTRHRERLEQREDGRMEGPDWYGYIYPKNLEIIGGRKMISRDIVESVTFTLDADGDAAFTTGYGIILKRETSLTLCYVLALLNSSLLDFIFKQVNTLLRGGYVRVFTEYLEPMPIRHIDFTTPADEREALVSEAKTKAEESIQALALSRTFGADTPMGQAMQAQAAAPAISFVEERLNAEPEQADVVHDLLAHLAERMIEMNEQKQERVESFWLDLEGVTDADTFEQLSEHGKWEASLWKADACRPFVDEESRSTRHLDESLAWNEDCFKAFVKMLAGRVSNLSEVIGVYRRHHPDFQALARRIAATDRLIDLIVYRLYGLKADEVAVVEGET